MITSTADGPRLRSVSVIAVTLLIVSTLAGCSQRSAGDGVFESNGPVRRIGGLENVDNSIYALGSVWVVTSNAPDRFSVDVIEANVVRIDAATGRSEVVLEGLNAEPTLAVTRDRLWVAIEDRLLALDEAGSATATIELEPGSLGDVVATNDHLWVVDFEGSKVSVIDASGPAIIETIDTGRFPVRPISAFGHIWIPSITDGTVTIVDEATFGDTTLATPFVSSEQLTDVISVPDGRTGAEVWAIDIEGRLFAISAEGSRLGAVREIELDVTVNRVAVHGSRAFVLPIWGLDVVVVDVATEQVIERIRTGATPFRALVVDGMVWVAGDGPQEIVTVVDTETSSIRRQLAIGSNSSRTTGPRQPLQVGSEVWIPNRGDGAIFIVDSRDL